MEEIKTEEIDILYGKLDKEAEAGGYHLNNDIELVRDLLNGLLVNEKRYGYQSCPCRLASGNKNNDLDIICPCYYRDPDLNDYGTCYCGLYVTGEALAGRKKIGPIPERRNMEEAKKNQDKKPAQEISHLPLPVWRCKVCGYLCAREAPPETCPICKATKERFERFILAL